MNSKGQQIADAVSKEIEDNWPHCSVEFKDGKTHPKMTLRFGKLMKSMSFSGTPTSVENSIKSSLGQVRRTLRQMGAERAKPESDEEDEKVARKRNEEGVSAWPNPVEGEKATPPDTLFKRMSDMAKKGDIPKPPAQPRPPAVAEEEPPRRVDVGEYDDIDGEEYLADPCIEPSLSASVGKIIIEKSCRHAAEAHIRLNPNHEPIDKHQFRVGRAFHTMILGKGAPIEVLDYPTWQTKESKQRRDEILQAGGTPLLKKQWENIQLMVPAVRHQIKQRQEIAYAMAGGVPERVYIWKEETPYGPIYCRMMVDWTPHSGDLVPDFKSTAVEAFQQWGARTMWDTGCDFQDAFYRRGFRHFNREFEAMMFVVCETDAPHQIMHHRIDPFSQDEADQMVQHAINMWGYCIHKGRWPGYPLNMAWQTRPGYRSQNLELRKNSGLIDHAKIVEEVEMHIRHGAENKAMLLNDKLVESTSENPFGLPPIREGEGDDQ